MYVEQFNLLNAQTLQGFIQFGFQVRQSIIKMTSSIGLTGDTRLSSNGKKILSLFTLLRQIGTNAVLRPAQPINIRGIDMGNTQV